jgi:hypothetical protein
MVALLHFVFSGQQTLQAHAANSSSNDQMVIVFKSNRAREGKINRDTQQHTHATHIKTKCSSRDSLMPTAMQQSAAGTGSVATLA